MDNISRYFKDIRKSSPLTLQQEIDLARKIKAGDRIAEGQLVEANLKFVVTVARTYQGRGLELDDLIAEGNIGLIEAARRFDPDAGFRFVSYAVYWIRQAIILALSENREIKLPVNKIGDLNKIRKAKEQATLEGIALTERELSKITGIAIPDIRNIEKASRSIVSVDTKIGEDEDSTLESIIKCDGADIDADIFDESANTNINLVLRSMLTEKEVDIIKYTYGIDYQELSDEKIGKKLDISSERVRQIRNKSLMRLRKNKKVIELLREYI